MWLFSEFTLSWNYFSKISLWNPKLRIIDKHKHFSSGVWASWVQRSVKIVCSCSTCPYSPSRITLPNNMPTSKLYACSFSFPISTLTLQKNGILSVTRNYPYGTLPQENVRDYKIINLKHWLFAKALTVNAHNPREAPQYNLHFEHKC